MTKYTFNESEVVVGETFPLVSDEVLANTPQLSNCPLERAVQFGGKVIRELLQAAPLVGDQEYIRVDLLGAYLNPGWYNIAPGWHLDGTPRQNKGEWVHPDSGYAASLAEQQRRSETGVTERLHTMVLGNDCPTKFLDGPVTLDLEHAESPDLNAEIDDLVEEGDYPYSTFPAYTWTTWDWWHIHCASPAVTPGQRLLVRVIETSFPPNTTSFVQYSRVIYAPQNFKRR